MVVRVVCADFDDEVGVGLDDLMRDLGLTPGAPAASRAPAPAPRPAMETPADRPRAEAPHAPALPQPAIPPANPYPVLAALVTIPGPERAAWLQQRLPGLRAVPFTQDGRPGLNLFWGPEMPTVWVGAHHDLDPGTVQGALDNGASVAALVDLIERGAMPADVGVAFWDGEELTNGGAMDGSSAHARQLVAEATARGVPPAPVIVLDVLGRGDLMVSGGRGGKEFLRALGTVPQARDMAAMEVYPQTPPSDNLSFLSQGIASPLLIALPRDAKGERVTDHWRTLHSTSDHIRLVRASELAVQSDGVARVATAVRDALQAGWRPPVVSAELRGQAAGELGANRAWSAYIEEWRQERFPHALPVIAPEYVEGFEPGIDPVTGAAIRPEGALGTWVEAQAAAGGLVISLPGHAWWLALPVHPAMAAQIAHGESAVVDAVAWQPTAPGDPQPSVLLVGVTPTARLSAAEVGIAGSLLVERLFPEGGAIETLWVESAAKPTGETRETSQDGYVVSTMTRSFAVPAAPLRARLPLRPVGGGGFGGPEGPRPPRPRRPKGGR